MMKKQVWQDAVYFYTRINKGTIDLPELRYYLCSTYPEVDFTEGIRQHLTTYLPDCLSALRYVKKTVYLDILAEPKDGEKASALTTRLKEVLKQYPPLKERLSLFSFDFTTPQNLSEDNCLVFK